MVPNAQLLGRESKGYAFSMIIRFISGQCSECAYVSILCVYLNLLLYVGVSNMAGYWVLLRFQPFDDGDVLDFGF